MCSWIILGHIVRGDLESREDDISLPAWVSGLRGRFQEGRKCLFFYYVSLCVGKHPHKSGYCFHKCCMSERCFCTVMWSTDTYWRCHSCIIRVTTCLLTTLNVCCVTFTFRLLKPESQQIFPEFFSVLLTLNMNQ